MSPEDHEAALAAERERRLNDLDQDLREVVQELHACQAGIGKLAETQAAQAKELDALHQSSRDFRDDLGTVRDGQRNLVLAIVGFALTVAGSAIGLALALGGHA